VQYVIVPIFFGLITGFVGKRKGSSFLIWFLIGTIVPIIGLVAAILSRDERIDPRRECPRCGKLTAITSQVCTVCGEDFEYPEELVVPEAYARSGASRVTAVEIADHPSANGHSSDGD
jgi:hypothetical protein